jgi:IclR family acetate operon transcriptional repressor
MHATASGKAILGEYPTYRVEEIIDQWGLPSKTSNTITSTNDLFAELDQIQKRGFAVDDEEFTDGLRSVGKAVTLPNGNVLGAFSVSGPTYRMNGPVLNEEIPEALMDMVEHLEDEIESTGAY